MHSYRVLKKEPRYRILFWSSVLNGMGSRFAQVGSFALLYLLTESSLALGSLLALRVIPTILFASLSGYLADRFHKAKLLLWIDLLRAPFALLPLWVVHTDHLWLLYLSTFVIASGEAMYRPIRFAAIPDIVQKKNLLSVNGLEQNVVGLTLVFGSLLGGIIAFVSDVTILFFIHTIFLLLAATLIARLAKIESIPKLKDNVVPVEFSLKESGFLLFKVALLRVFLMVMLLMPLANGVDNVIFNLIALDVFEKGDLGVGLIYASLGMGLILSSTIAKWIRGKYMAVGAVMIFLEGVGHLLLSQSFFFLQALLLAAAIACAVGVSNICFDTVLMKILPASKRGVLIGTLSMFENSSMGIAMVGAGFLSEWLAPLKTAFLVGITYIFFALIFIVIFKSINVRESLRKLNHLDKRTEEI
ncbi:MFS transporter [Alkalicoccobacillus plakortidis]|uniref:MFS transporter n=1 Tax=Alkalicoccobacillus plakortidis TaxID=444060 RepID=A0ABT0XG82_9BACI|nr:MFS transporter [Alkalicoccobacillus plakortidis]MCM2674916.1 MFS transporter [Alkalicoccobacillus plakortidis]